MGLVQNISKLWMVSQRIVNKSITKSTVHDPSPSSSLEKLVPLVCPAWRGCGLTSSSGALATLKCWFLKKERGVPGIVMFNYLHCDVSLEINPSSSIFILTFPSSSRSNFPWKTQNASDLAPQFDPTCYERPRAPSEAWDLGTTRPALETQNRASVLQTLMVSRTQLKRT